MDHLPDEARLPNIYYWYYATQVMHNMAGYEWDAWNRKMRKLLVTAQSATAALAPTGSWDPSGDPGASSGGRVMMTALSCLTLEIYYRYLPLFKAEAGGGAVVNNVARGQGGRRGPPRPRKPPPRRSRNHRTLARRPLRRTCTNNLNNLL